jgi:phosphatidate cytidylyltransferase
LIKRIATAVVLIPIVLLLVLRAPLPALALVTGAIALITVYEFLKLTEAYGIRPFYKPTYVVIALFFVFLAIDVGTPLLSTGFFLVGSVIVASLLPFVFLTLAMRSVDLSSAFPAASATVFAFGYVALPMGLFVNLRQQASGAILVIYLLLVVWAGDIFAYFVGRSVGRHLMSPRISPKKTWEGAAASVIASTIIGTAFYKYALPISSALLNAHLIQRRDGYFDLNQPALLPIVVLSVVVNIAAQLGDLVESLIKRGAGVKDSGAILPGHGGMLDRIDALLFAAPVLWCWVIWPVLR